MIASGDGLPATLWIDDVSVAEVEPQTAAAPAATGNVLPDADFEIPFDRDWQCRGGNLQLDDDSPFHGRHSLHWELGGRRARLCSRAIEFAGDGRPFTLALAARARGDATLIADVWPAVNVDHGEPLLRLECKPGAQWRVFRTTGPLPPSSNGAYYVAIQPRGRDGGDLWLDAVRLEPGDGEGPFHCRRPIEASLTSAPVAHIYRVGKPVELGIEAFCDAAEPHQAAAGLPCDGLLASPSRRGSRFAGARAAFSRRRNSSIAAAWHRRFSRRACRRRKRARRDFFQRAAAGQQRPTAAIGGRQPFSPR